MQQLNREAGGKRKLRKRHPDHTRLADKDTNVVQSRPILDNASGLKLAEPRSRLVDLILSFGYDEQAVSSLEH